MAVKESFIEMGGTIGSTSNYGTNGINTYKVQVVH